MVRELRPSTKNTLAVTVIALLLTLAYTAPYAVANQATYLLEPLHRAMPELFHRDWFVNTPSYQPVYGWLAQWLYRVDGEGPIAFLAMHVIVTLATYAALYSLTSAIQSGWRAFAIVAAFVAATMDNSMGGSYLLAWYFQPSSVATLGWLVALAAFVRARYLACGVALALAGLIHVNFLVLGLPLFGLAALARRGVRWRDHAQLFAPQLIVLGCLLPFLLSVPGLSKSALHILADFHAPVHYAPSRIAFSIPPLLGWQLGAFAALRLGQPGREELALWWFSVAGCVLTVGSALLMQIDRFSFLTQLYWARIAPFEELSCQVLMACALVRYVSSAAPPTAMRRRIAIALCMITPLVLAWRYVVDLWPASSMLLSATSIVVIILGSRRVSRWLVAALPGVAVVAALSVSPRGHGLTTRPAVDPDDLALMEWARTNTPVDALFLAPPRLAPFRLLARRAVVADFKSVPLQPAPLAEWYRRICAMVNLTDATSKHEIEVRYSTLPLAELDASARRFGADYIVMQRPDPARAPVYANPHYAVYAVQR